MTASKNQTTGEFAADTINGESPTFYTTGVKLAVSSRPVPVPYWQAIGIQTFPGPLPQRQAALSVYFPEGTTPDTYTLTENGDYRASYDRGTLSDSKTYLATSGTLILKVVPTEGDPRLDGSVEFTAKLQNGEETVEIKNGRFVMEGLTP
jgi:hypothetical protein